MSEIIKLKPCPFCGNEHLGVHIVHNWIFTGEAYVSCHNCGAEGKRFQTMEDMAEEEMRLKAIAADRNREVSKENGD